MTTRDLRHQHMLRAHRETLATELAADRVVHTIGLLAAAVALAWLAIRAGTGIRGVISVAVYGAGLIGMLSASAVYNLTPTGPLTATWRRLDRSMIFVMIAGSYTPFALVLRPSLGLSLCGVIWALAVLGITIEQAFPYRFERFTFALYLAMGWVLVLILPPVIAALPGASLVLLVAGGLIYSAGAVVHVTARMPYYTACWHTMVVVAAGLHLGAIALLFPEHGRVLAELSVPWSGGN